MLTKTVVSDDRTPEQMKTHRWLVIGTDSFLSGWGQARGTTSYAAWACETESEAAECYRRIEARSDMKRVRIVYEPEKGRKYRPKQGHLHIYVYRNQYFEG